VKIYKNVPAVIAMALSLFAALGLAPYLFIFDQLMAWANSSDNPSGLSTWLLILWTIAAPLLAIFAAASPALKIKPRLTLLFVGVTLAIVLVLDPLTNLLWSIQAQQPIGFLTLTQCFFPGFGDLYTAGRSLATIFGVLGAIALAMGFIVKPQPLTSTGSASPNLIFQGTAGAVTPNLSASSQVVSSLPTLSLVLAFFSPVIAIVLGHVALNRMRSGLISSSNISTAKAGLVLGYVFTGLGLIAIIFLVTFFAPLLALWF
jgi:hypothetical protein